MGNAPAAEGTADYRNRGRVSKLENKSDVVRNSFIKSRGKKEAKPKGERRSSCEPPPLKPDKKPPELHRMGKYTWTRQDRKLDALFAIYVMGWETKSNQYTEWRYWIRPSSWGGWEADMLPYFHDDTRSCYQGIEVLRKKGIYLTIETRVDGYEVVEKTMELSVRDKDLNFAIIAVCLLIQGISNKDIQHAWDNQNDFSKKAAKRRQEKDNAS